MPDFSLTPVEGNPFAGSPPSGGPTLVPVEGNPFETAPQAERSGPAGAASSMGLGALDALAAGTQGTSPVVTGSRGYNYQLAPDAEQWAVRETGAPLNQQKYVALRDPHTGEYRAFERSPEMEEGRLPAVGRALGLALPETGIPSAAEKVITPAQSLLMDFERSGVTPNVPAVGQGIGSRLGANIISKVPVVGGTIVKGAQRTLEDTGAAAEGIAGGYGASTNAEEAGTATQRGLEQFAKGKAPAGMSASDIISAPTRASSFPAKSEALYDRFWSMMDPNAQIPLTNTLDALKGPLERFPTNPALGRQITSPTLQSLFSTAAPKTTITPPVFSSILDQSGNPILLQASQKIQSGGSLTMPELKELRSYVGRMLGEPMLVSDIPRADLKQVYGGITDDLKSAANATGPDAARAFDTASNYYRAGIDRIDQIEPLLKGSPEQSFAAINRAAGEGSSADAGLLRSLKRSVPASDWGNVGAAVIRRMGEPTPGAADVLAGHGGGASFSPASFTTNWNKLSDAAKDTLFGVNQPGSDREALESIVRVAGASKNVSKLANPSGTASHLIAGAGALGLAEHWQTIAEHPIASILTGLGGYGTARALASPGFARWLYSVPGTLKSAGSVGTGIQRALGSLDMMARNNPDLAIAADHLRGALGP